MDEFEKKYGFKEDEKTTSFHKSRRMFTIHNNQLFIAKPNLPYSHAVWFEKEGWISKEKDNLMNKIVWRIIDKKGDIYFYKGYDFRIDQESESLFFMYLKELSEKIKLESNSEIFWGWPPIKKYGKIKDNL